MNYNEEQDIKRMVSLAIFKNPIGVESVGLFYYRCKKCGKVAFEVECEHCALKDKIDETLNK